jgi:HEPN domain-containing protein
MRQWLSDTFDHILVWLRLKEPKQAADVEVLRMLYLTTALQYHITARYAAFAGFVPVCGLLFHHAIEMYLKGQLCRKLDEFQLRNLGHKLEKLWKKFKAEMSDRTLDQFNQVISELDRHERIRYPETIASRGMIGLIQFKPATTRGVQGVATGPQPQFMIVVDDLDALAKTILDKSGVDPRFFTAGLNDDATSFLTRDNKSIIW